MQSDLYDAYDGTAVVDITESVCLEATGEPQVIPVNEQIETVAVAMAEAIARVAVDCTGQGEAVLVVSGNVNVVAMAEAIGTATAHIVASSGVCGLCEQLVDSFAESMETVSAKAVAQLEIEEETLRFNNAPLSRDFVERVVEENAIDVIASIVGEIRTSERDGCSAAFLTRATVNGSTAECDTAITADDIITEVDGFAEAVLEVSAISCGDGGGNSVRANITVDTVAVAIAQAVTVADTFCESSESEVGSAMACALSRGSVEAVATARAEAVVTALGQAIGTECGCELRANFTTDDIRTILARSTSSAFASVCVNSTEQALASDFQSQVEEQLRDVFTQLFVSATADYDECDVIIDAIAEVRNPNESNSPGSENEAEDSETGEYNGFAFGYPALEYEAFGFEKVEYEYLY